MSIILLVLSVLLSFVMFSLVFLAIPVVLLLLPVWTWRRALSLPSPSVCAPCKKASDARAPCISCWFWGRPEEDRANRGEHERKGDAHQREGKNRQSSGQSQEQREQSTETQGDQEIVATYAILGLSPGASQNEVIAAYRELARQYHPDKVSHLGEEFVEMAHAKFTKIQGAYETLTSCSV